MARIAVWTDPALCSLKMTHVPGAGGTIDWTSWLHTSQEDLVAYIESCLARAQAQVTAVKRAPAPRTFDNLALALEDSTNELDNALACLRHLESVATTPSLRSVFNRTQPAASLFYNSLGLDPDIWDLFANYARSEEALHLKDGRARHLERLLQSFSTHGGNLHEDERAQLNDLDIELQQMTTEFAENVPDDTNAAELHVTAQSALAGLSEEMIEHFRDNAVSRGKSGWVITLQAPSYVSVMTHVKDSSVRRELYSKYMTRAVTKNSSLVSYILRARRAKARILGFHTFADLAVADRMVRSGDRAKRFLEVFADKVWPTFEAENQTLESFAKCQLHPWDIAFWAERLRETQYQFSDDTLRPFFALDNVLKAVFELAWRLFGVRIEPAPLTPAYRRDVRYYRVSDETGRLIAGLYLDPFPDAAKRGGAWFDALVTGCTRDHNPHICVICTNVTPPTYGEPSLLSPPEVETIFFMFGYFLHQALSAVESRSLSGTSVPWDFVTFVAEVFQSFCWEPDVLKLYAFHWRTHAPIDRGAIKEMQRSRRFRIGNKHMRQLGFGLLDLKLHMEYNPEFHGSPITYSKQMIEKFSPAPLPDNYGMIAAFTHLFASPVAYAGGYYSFKWSEALATFASQRFRRNGILNRKIGREFIDCVLSKGNSSDPIEQFEKFTGWPLDFERIAEAFVVETIETME